MASLSQREVSHCEEVGRLKYFPEVFLSKGAFGSVYKGKFDGSDVAVKRIVQDPNDKRAIEAELGLVRFGNEAWHENVVRYLHKEQDKRFLYIAIELCVGTLEDLLEKKIPKNVPSPGPKEEILRQITCGLEFLHSNHIVHRDINPGNIWLSSKGVLKLADFGLFKEKKESATSFSFTGHIGTDGWAAPELLKENPGKFNFAIDIFSLGCVFGYTLTSGSHPFGAPPERTMNIIKGEIKNEVLNKIEDNELKRLTEQMISYRPEYRPSLNKIKVTLMGGLTAIKKDIYLKIFRHVPATHQSSALMEKFCKNGATLDICDEYRKTLLHYACKNYKGNDLSQVIRLLIERGAKVDARDISGKTPLHYACANYEGNDFIEVIRLLVEHGAKVDAYDKVGRSPLHFACKNYKGNYLSHVIRLLIERGAKVDACDEDGWTPLHYACWFYKGNDLSHVIRVLIEHGAKVDDCDKLNGRTPLHYASATYNGEDLIQVIRLLIEHGAKVDACDEYGKTPLLYACANDKVNDLIEVIRLFIEHGAKVDACDIIGRTPLHYACVNYMGNDCYVIRVLIEHGAKVDARDKWGRTPLHYACKNYKGNDLSQVIRVLIECGAKVDAGDEFGKTPLHYICKYYKRNDLSEVIRLLIENGAKVDVDAEIGMFPLHYAARLNVHALEVLRIAASRIDNRKTFSELDETATIQNESIGLVVDMPMKVPIDNKMADLNKNEASGDDAVCTVIAAHQSKRRNKKLFSQLDRLTKLIVLNITAILLVAVLSQHSINVTTRYEIERKKLEIQVNNATTIATQSQNQRDNMKTLIEVFIEGGTDVKWTLDNWNALMYLFKYFGDAEGMLPLVQELVRKGVNVNEKETSEGWTPLYVVAKYFGNNRNERLSDIVQVLLESGAKADVALKDGWNSLHLACRYYQKDDLIEVIELLIEHGANPDGRLLHAGDNALTIATQYQTQQENIVEILEILIDAGADVNCKDFANWNALMTLCNFYENPEGLLPAVELLVQKGINVNEKQDDGWTALHFLTRHFGNNRKDNLSDVIRILLDSGAEAHVLNKNGWTPLHYACIHYQRDDLNEVIQLLINHGAIADHRDPDGDNARALVTKFYSLSNKADVLRLL